MSRVSTHILDTARGGPASGVRAVLDCKISNEWRKMGEGWTNADGRISSFLASGTSLNPGIYRLVFDTGTYQGGFFPEVVIVFNIDDVEQNYHVPLLLSPFGYSTYRGS